MNGSKHGVSLSVESHIATLTMADTAGRNALSGGFVAELLDAFEQAKQTPDVRVVVLRGLPEVFCSGADLSVLGDLKHSRVRPSELGVAETLLKFPVPIVAACEGYAIGGGFTLALACDFVVLANEHRYGFNFMDLGITPGMGTTRLAAYFLGEPTANELMFSCECRKGRDFRGSQISRTVPSTDVWDAAMDLASRIAQNPRHNIELLKQSLTLGRRKDFIEGMTLESLMHETTLANLNLMNFGGTHD